MRREETRPALCLAQAPGTRLFSLIAPLLADRRSCPRLQVYGTYWGEGIGQKSLPGEGEKSYRLFCTGTPKVSRYVVCRHQGDKARKSSSTVLDA